MLSQARLIPIRIGPEIAFQTQPLKSHISINNATKKCTMSLIDANFTLKHAYATNERFRQEYYVLLAFLKCFLQNQNAVRVLTFHHNRSKSFDLFLPSILEFLDAPSLIACESVCQQWNAECRANENSNWEALLVHRFLIQTRAFRSRSLGTDPSNADDDQVSAKRLYSHCHQKFLQVLYPGRRGGSGGSIHTAIFQ